MHTQCSSIIICTPVIGAWVAIIAVYWFADSVTSTIGSVTVSFTDSNITIGNTGTSGTSVVNTAEALRTGVQVVAEIGGSDLTFLGDMVACVVVALVRLTAGDFTVVFGSIVLHVSDWDMSTVVASSGVFPTEVKGIWEIVITWRWIGVDIDTATVGVAIGTSTLVTTI